MIPQGGIYNDTARSAGEIAGHHPAEFIMTGIIEGVIPFGTAVVRGTDGDQVKLPSSAADKMIGVAGRSIEASGFDDEVYADGDPAGIVETGIVVVKVEEGVSLADSVRIRHGEDVRAGYQEWGFDAAKTGASASGLANDTTTYGAIAVIDGKVKEISVVGSVSQTLTALIAALNADIGSAGLASFVNGKIRIVSAIMGEESSVLISDGNDSASADLFATLTDASDNPDEAVSGSGDVSPGLEPGNFCKTAVAGKTAVVSGAQWVSEASGAGLAVLYVNGPFSLTADV